MYLMYLDICFVSFIVGFSVLNEIKCALETTPVSTPRSPGDHYWFWQPNVEMLAASRQQIHGLSFQRLAKKSAMGYDSLINALNTLQL